VGSLLGSLKDFSGIELAIASTRSALSKTGVDPNTIDQVIMGNVISAGLGQNPARQISIGSGINPEASCLNINKVCASGMKSVMFGAQSLSLGNGGVILAGGFESMTNAPHILNNYRKGHKFGDYKIIDSLSFDGLTDPYRNIAMGFCGEHTVTEMGISREIQDEYCISSYERALEAEKKGIFAQEIVSLTTRRGEVIDRDEEPKRYNPDKIKTLKPVFVSK
jgi:acetyl-CoA C-acetyltransferase